MPVPNQINTKLMPEAATAVTAALAALETHLTLSDGLSSEERMAFPKMGVQGNDFVREVLQVADENTDLIPAAIDLNEMHLDYDLVQTLLPIQGRLRAILESVDDAILEAGSEAFVAALQAYDILKRLGKGTNLDANLQSMSRRFKRTSHLAQTPPTGGADQPA